MTGVQTCALPILGSGQALHWKTTVSNKVVIFNQFRDGFALNQIRIKSVECLREMEKVVQDGIQIKGEGSAKDDRPMAVALATRAWIDGERKRLQHEGHSREAAAQAKDMTHVDMNRIFTSNVVQDFLSRQQAQRRFTEMKRKKGNRWNW